MSNDRIDLVRQVQKAHMFASASSKEARGGEAWRCQCGVGFTGTGALERGHRHEAAEIVAVLDEGRESVSDVLRAAATDPSLRLAGHSGVSVRALLARAAAVEVTA